MTGNLIHGTSVDSVRIDVLGAGRALTIPLDCLVCVDAILRSLLPMGRLIVVPEWNVGMTELSWKAATEDACGRGETPWQAIVALAEQLS